MSTREEVLNRLCREYEENNQIDKELYQQLNICRGLRNPDGTGVPIGITNVCSVRGYIVDDGVRTPTEGKLRYRGISVEDLVDGKNRNHYFGFEEVVWLLLFGTLPNKKTLDWFRSVLAEQRALPEYFVEDQMLKNPSKSIMNKMARSILVLYSYDNNPDDVSLENVLQQCISLIATMPTIMTYAYQIKRRHFDGKSMFFHPIDTSLSIAESILMAIRADKKFTEEEANILDTCLMLHADHGGGNNSTFSVRCLTSTGTDTYSAIAAGISSLKGPLHGGANIQVDKMVEDFKRNVPDLHDDGAIKDHIVKTLRKETGDGRGLVYGMGHAVYTLSDPRAKILKSIAEQKAADYGMEDTFRLLDAIERLTPEVFAEINQSEKPICANVDLYSGLIYHMLGIHQELFTPLFASARIAGWSAHRMEELNSYSRIMRPAYRAAKRPQPYIAMGERD